jgi:SpoVK/Ycf46/Vps4 family AAA+-type ATPase
LNPVVMDEIQNINTWLLHKDEITENKILSKKLNKGYKCLFYGPPGTGKTLSTALIGKKNKKDVYRIDLSQIVSKYVGETEKNLAKIFNIAENKDWILFFDEAESLFSKRTSVNDSKDKFANQQTAYLLQRVEEYKGLIILATNLKPNIDIAFSRRIQSIINFSMPDIRERKILWTNFLADLSDIDETTIGRLAKEYPLSGGSIKNVIQSAWLLAKRNQSEITEKEIIQGIRRELIKDGKSIDSI